MRAGAHAYVASVALAMPVFAKSCQLERDSVTDANEKEDI